MYVHEGEVAPQVSIQIPQVEKKDNIKIVLKKYNIVPKEYKIVSIFVFMGKNSYFWKYF